MVLSNETVLISISIIINMQTTEALVGSSGGQSPPEAETCLTFGYSMEAANLPAF